MSTTQRDGVSVSVPRAQQQQQQQQSKPSHAALRCYQCCRYGTLAGFIVGVYTLITMLWIASSVWFSYHKALHAYTASEAEFMRNYTTIKQQHDICIELGRTISNIDGSILCEDARHTWSIVNKTDLNDTTKHDKVAIDTFFAEMAPIAPWNFMCTHLSCIRYSDVLLELIEEIVHHLPYYTLAFIVSLMIISVMLRQYYNFVKQLDLRTQDRIANWLKIKQNLDSISEQYIKVIQPPLPRPPSPPQCTAPSAITSPAPTPGRFPYGKAQTIGDDPPIVSLSDIARRERISFFVGQFDGDSGYSHDRQYGSNMKLKTT